MLARHVSVSIAAARVEVAHGSGLANSGGPDDLFSFIRSQIYEPADRAYV
jgi:hypothetical protein